MEPVIPRKRPLSMAYHCKIEELKKHGRLVQAVRDFPPGCGFNKAEINPSKKSEKIDSNLGKTVNSHPVKSNKFNCIKPIDFGNSKAYVASRPVGKVKFWDPICKEAGYNQKPKVTVTHGMQRKNVNSNISTSTLNGKDDRLVNSHPVENSKLKSLEPKESIKNKSYLGSRSTSKVKFWDPICEAQKSESATVVSPNEEIEHKKIQQALAMFDQVFDQLSQENKLKPKDVKISPFGVSMQAAKIVKKKMKLPNPVKILGPVCGIQIGDKFRYRSQLMMFGLHCQPQSGIDYTNIEGKKLAISIVDAHRYSNESESSDTLVYCGQGGHGLYGPKSPPEDQTLKTGNLAMKNSIDKKSMVRVIRKVKCFEKDVFAYDGLYKVNNYTQGKSAEGKTVFKFYLNRLPGQPSLQKMLKC
ncbi:hypothetical protein E3N88_38641 [Mikania micrantha]|uniref:YDG domain-containing protein n=1 Tax=Mikania micrantha TaxID=192012 RepID=A0A5N6LUK0_9ASTR|nr:hypothetical protein E3N88_38641 [Mikania micrantha]